VVGLRSVLSRYGGLLTSGLNYLAPGFKVLVRDNPERLRKELEDWIGRTGCRLVILIDDIDRISQVGEVLAVLKLVGLSARIRQAVFVLSFDPVAISGMLHERVSVDPAFLEKVIQKPLPLPPAEQRDIDRFLLFSDSNDVEAHRSGIDRLLDELEVEPERRIAFDQQIVSFYQPQLRKLFRTMRQAKRYLNSLRATLSPVVDEVNLYDFVLLEILQVFFPTVYQDIWRVPWFYIPPWTDEVWLNSFFSLTSNTQEKYRRINEHIEQLLIDESQADIVKSILEKLFFVEVGNALSRVGLTVHDNMVETYRAEKRLTHPACFPRYFLFRLPAGEIADKAVEELLRIWNETPASDVEGLISHTFQQYKERNQLRELLIKLHIFMEMVTQGCVTAIVRVLYQNVPNFSRVHPDLRGSAYDQAKRLILWLLEERVAEADIRPLLEEIVCKVQSLPFAVSIVLSCHRANHGHFPRTYQHIDLNILRGLTSQRLHTFFVQGNRDIFAELSEEDSSLVLFQWGTDWMTLSGENRSVVQEYVIGLIDQRPEYLGPLLRLFVLGDVDPHFRFDDFCHIYNPSDVLNRLKCYGDQVLSSLEDRQAAELFRQAYINSEQHQTETRVQAEDDEVGS
jgi:hypothetical protein